MFTLLRSFPKQSLNPGSVHCRWVQIFTKGLRRLIYLREKNIGNVKYVRKTQKHRTKVCEAEKVRKYFVNPKIENEVFG